MIFFLIVGLILGACSVIFALQNVAVVTVTLFTLHIQASLSVIILASIATGVVICVLFTLPEVIINSFRFRSLKKENKRLEDEVAKQKSANSKEEVIVQRTETTETHTI